MADGTGTIQLPAPAPVAPGPGPPAPTPAGDRAPPAARAVAHLAVAVTLVASVVADLARGWRPLSDDAVISFRAYSVFGAHSPLVGQATRALQNQPVYGLGPVEYWMLALPVRIDPVHGALWGAALWVLAGAILAIEAGWVAAGPGGALAVSGMLSVLLITWPAIALDPVWNQWLGIVWLVTAMAAAWAARARRGWWVVALAVATVAAQAQEVYALAAVGAGAVGLVAGLRRAGPGRWRTVLAGLAVVVAGWTVPVVQEVTGSPGNLSLLVRGAERVTAHLGVVRALRGLGAAVTLPPRWWHAAPSGGPDAFYFMVATFAGPAWLGAVALVVVAAVALGAHRAGRHRLAVAAAVTLAMAVGTVAALSRIPEAQIVTLCYLQVLLWVAGMAVLAVVVWAAVDVARAFTPRSSHRRRRPALRWLAGGLVAGGLGAVSLAVCLAVTAGDLPTLVSWQAVHDDVTAAHLATRVAPAGPFLLVVAGGRNDESGALDAAVGYLLEIEGFEPRFTGPPGWQVGPAWRARAGLPVVTVTLPPSSGGRLVVRVTRPATKVAGHGAAR